MEYPRLMAISTKSRYKRIEIAATPSGPMSLIMIMLNKKVVTLVDRLLTISDEPLVMVRIRVCMEARGFTKCSGASLWRAK